MEQALVGTVTEMTSGAKWQRMFVADDLEDKTLVETKMAFDAESADTEPAGRFEMPALGCPLEHCAGLLLGAEGVADA